MEELVRLLNSLLKFEMSIHLIIRIGQMISPKNEIAHSINWLDQPIPDFILFYDLYNVRLIWYKNEKKKN